MKHCFFVLALFLSFTPAYADFDIAPYAQENTASITRDIFYPEYFKETDPINISNIFSEFKSRYEFFAGISAVPTSKYCFKLQARIDKWIKNANKKGLNPYKWVDDELLFNKSSPLHNLIRPTIEKPDDRCSFVSYGDLNKAGGVFCKFHGPDPRSEFYQAHNHDFLNARPFITAYDITEILIFLPFMMVIPISWLVMKKILGSKK